MSYLSRHTVHCIALQYVAVRCQWKLSCIMSHSALQCVNVMHSALQCVNVMQYVVVHFQKKNLSYVKGVTVQSAPKVDMWLCKMSVELLLAADVYIHMYIYVFVYLFISMYKCTYIYVYIHMYMYRLFRTSTSSGRWRCRECVRERECVFVCVSDMCLRYGLHTKAHMRERC